jgi:hypothetical protein
VAMISIGAGVHLFTYFRRSEGTSGDLKDATYWCPVGREFKQNRLKRSEPDQRVSRRKPHRPDRQHDDRLLRDATGENRRILHPQ